MADERSYDAKCEQAYAYIFHGIEGAEALIVWRANVERLLKSVDNIKTLMQSVLVGVILLLAKGVYEHYNPPTLVVTQQSTTSPITSGVPTVSTSKTTETQSH